MKRQEHLVKDTSTMVMPDKRKGSISAPPVLLSRLVDHETPLDQDHHLRPQSQVPLPCEQLA